MQIRAACSAFLRFVGRINAPAVMPVSGGPYKWVVGFLIALTIGSQVLAADLPSPSPLPSEQIPVYNVTGAYIGAQAAYGSGSSIWTDAVVASSTGSFPIAGVLAGGTIGANYQVGEFVFGVESDVAWSSVVGTPGPVCVNLAAVLPPLATCETKSGWLATARGRLGYLVDRFLLYGTAGAALGNIQAGLGPPSFDSASKLGWTAGVGFEAFISRNWSAKLEYLFVDLANGSCATLANCAGAAGSAVEFNENIARAGINYRFGW